MAPYRMRDGISCYRHHSLDSVVGGVGCRCHDELLGLGGHARAAVAWGEEPHTLLGMRTVSGGIATVKVQFRFEFFPVIQGYFQFEKTRTLGPLSKFFFYCLAIPF